MKQLITSIFRCQTLIISRVLSFPAIFLTMTSKFGSLHKYLHLYSPSPCHFKLNRWFRKSHMTYLPSEAKICNFDASILVDEKILWLHVSVQNSSLMTKQNSLKQLKI